MFYSILADMSRGGEATVLRVFNKSTNSECCYMVQKKKRSKGEKMSFGRMDFMEGRGEAKFTVLIPACLVSILSAPLRAANNIRGNNGCL